MGWPYSCDWPYACYPHAFCYGVYCWNQYYGSCKKVPRTWVLIIAKGEAIVLGGKHYKTH